MSLWRQKQNITKKFNCYNNLRIDKNEHILMNNLKTFNIDYMVTNNSNMFDNSLNYNNDASKYTNKNPKYCNFTYVSYIDIFNCIFKKLIIKMYNTNININKEINI